MSPIVKREKTKHRESKCLARRHKKTVCGRAGNETQISSFLLLCFSHKIIHPLRNLPLIHRNWMVLCVTSHSALERFSKAFSKIVFNCISVHLSSEMFIFFKPREWEAILVSEK